MSYHKFRTLGPTLTEAQEQKIVCQWLTIRDVFYTHVPNGGKRNLITAVNLKRIGVRAGIPDLLIFTPPPASPGVRGVAIEMKRKGTGKMSDAQKDAAEKFKECAWRVYECHGADHAIEILQAMGY